MIASDDVQAPARAHDSLQGLARVSGLAFDIFNDGEFRSPQPLFQRIRERGVVLALARDDENLSTAAKSLDDLCGELLSCRGAVRMLLIVSDKAVVKAQQQQNEQHAIIRNESGRERFHSWRLTKQYSHPTARFMISSCVAHATPVISPRMRPSCMTRIRSHIPRTSGNSELIIKIALP